MCLYVYLVFAGVVKDKFQPWLTINMYCIVLNQNKNFKKYNMGANQKKKKRDPQTSRLRM